MSQQAHMNMAAMGGPVGGGVGVGMNAGTPSNSGIDLFPSPQLLQKKLNTAIYDYLLRHAQYDIARSFSKEMPIETKTDTKESPSQRGGPQTNGVDDAMDDEAILKRPGDLPLPNNMIEGPLLQDWWCQFWELWHCMRNAKGVSKNGLTNYVANQRMAQKTRLSMMGAMDPNMQNLRAGYGMMQGMNNGIAMGPNDLRKSAMQQSNQQRQFTPAQVQQMKMQNAQQNPQMMQGNAMERQGSQMDGSGPRSGSPGSGDGPSSPKRQRVDGAMQQMNQGRPGQPGQMQGNQVGPSPDFPQPDPASLQQTIQLLQEKGIDPSKIPPQQLHKLSMQPTNHQAQSVEVYSHSIQQQMQAAMNNQLNKSNSNKGINPNMGPGGAQGSPMNQAGMDGGAGEFYANVNGRMPMPQNAAAAAAAAGQAGSNQGNHALQDYQMQLMLLEQQNKKRLLMARQEQDMAHPGVAPNGQFAPGMSPPGSQRGADPSPNPNDMRGRGSPTPGMIDPNQVPPQMRQMMQMGQNGQLQAMRQQGMQMPNGQFAAGQPQGQVMPGQQGGQPGQPGSAQPLGTPRQQQTNMPPPPAPPGNASGTQPSSPSQQPPPTPSQTNKAKPGTKKEPANKKGAANKKGGATGATPASESEQQPPTPTPATPATPMNANSFAHKQNQQLPNGQPAAPGQANAAGNANNQQNQTQQQQAAANAAAQAAQPPGADLPFGSLMEDNQFGSLGLDFGVGEDLDNFDFDSFLNDANDGGFGIDATFGFDGEIGLDGN